jgi:hypothetical protein
MEVLRDGRSRPASYFFAFLATFFLAFLAGFFAAFLATFFAGFLAAFLAFFLATSRPPNRRVGGCQVVLRAGAGRRRTNHR